MAPDPTTHKTPSLPEISGGRGKALNDGVLWKKKTSFVMTELTHVEGIVKRQGNSPLAVCMQTCKRQV